MSGGAVFDRVGAEGVGFGVVGGVRGAARFGHRLVAEHLPKGVEVLGAEASSGSCSG